VAYRYKLVPNPPVDDSDGAPVGEQTLLSDHELVVGDVVPVSPGTWTVERVGASGTTEWASEAEGRDDPQTTNPVTLYCRVDL